MENLLTRVFQPRERDRDGMLAEDAVLAYWTVAFVGQLAVVADAKLDAVPVRSINVGAQDAVALVKSRYRPVVEVGFAPSERFQVSQ
jgi:hypothetical protein